MIRFVESFNGSFTIVEILVLTQRHHCWLVLGRAVCHSPNLPYSKIVSSPLAALLIWWTFDQTKLCQTHIRKVSDTTDNLPNQVIEVCHTWRHQLPLGPVLHCDLQTVYSRKLLHISRPM